MLPRSTFFIVFVAAILISLNGCAGQPGGQKPVYIVFRYDDYSARSDTEMEIKLFAAFHEAGAPLTVGVIPFISSGVSYDPAPQEGIPLPTDKRELLKPWVQNGTVEVALHGYSHQTAQAEYLSEFAGLDYESQLERLSKGKVYLEELVAAPVSTFVPPWNTYDQHTLRALDALGFAAHSADKAGHVSAAARVRFLPSTTDLVHLRDAVQAARQTSDPQPIVVVLFHAYDFQEVDGERGVLTYPAFVDLLRWLNAQEDIHFLSVGQAAEVIDDLSPLRYQANKQNYELSRLLPHPLWDREISLIYHSVQAFPKAYLRIGVFYAFLILGASLPAWGIGLAFFRRAAWMRKITVAGSIAASAGILVYTFGDLNIHLRGMLASAIVVGMTLGFCCCALVLKRKSLRA
jgi:hypothetical protein